jgi:hypothetical protein
LSPVGNVCVGDRALCHPPIFFIFVTAVSMLTRYVGIQKMDLLGKTALLNTKKNETLIWVHPADTKKTVEDELDDMMCAPCLSKMRSGSCGPQMANFMRCTYKAFKTDNDFGPCSEIFQGIVSCWKANPREYARELKKYQKENAQATEQNLAM